MTTAADGVYGDPKAAAEYADNGDTKVSIGTFMTAWNTGQESIVVTAPAG